MDLIARNAPGPRIFPAVGWPHFGTDGVKQLIELVRSAISPRRLESGKGLGAKAPLRAVWLHCQAIKAEMEGRFEQADFLYRELDHDLQRLRSPRNWRAVAHLALDPAVAAALEPGTLQDAAIGDIFIDS